MPLRRRHNVFRINKTWEIKDINQLLERADRNGREDPVTLDPEFSEVLEGELVKWKVVLKISSSKLFPGGLSLSYIPISGTDDDVCTFYLVDIDKKDLYIGLCDQSTYTNREDPDFVPDRFQKKKEDLLPNNTMTLRMKVYSCWDWDRCPIPRPVYLPDPIEVPIDYFELYNSREDSGDVVVIQVQDDEFPVHRNLLEKNCPVLYEEVVRHQQTSNSNNNSELTLTDIEPEIFKKVVEYIYTDKVCNLDNHSEYLLEAADKYELKNLKKMCEKSLVFRYLNHINAPAIYDLAIRCHAPKLKEAVLFIWPNLEIPNAPRLCSYSKSSSSEYDYEITPCNVSTFCNNSVELGVDGFYNGDYLVHL